MNAIPHGFCRCGCGERTPIAQKGSTARGWVKGEPVKYLHGHYKPTRQPPTSEGPNPTGLCWCGCGQRTQIAKENRRGNVRGTPARYVQGHAGDKKPGTFEVDPKTGCWVWQGTRNSTGYAISGAKRRVAHRVFYERVNGPVPEGLELDHLCRNRACVNPDHLEAVTHLENVRRGFLARRGLWNPDLKSSATGPSSLTGGRTRPAVASPDAPGGGSHFFPIDPDPNYPEAA